ncbi:MAG: DNA-binding protein [Phycisphaerales bacterium]|nr:MAG: DNA-binding protein [Phycisphaerales bacterium]
MSLVTSEQVAERFGVTVNTVRRWVRERRIPAIRASRRVVRFDLAAVECALATIAPATAPRARRARP